MLTLGQIVDRDNDESDGHDNDPDHEQVPGGGGRGPQGSGMNCLGSSIRVAPILMRIELRVNLRSCATHGPSREGAS